MPGNRTSIAKVGTSLHTIAKPRWARARFCLDKQHDGSRKARNKRWTLLHEIDVDRLNLET